MLYNEVLVDRINKESFPNNTDSVVLPLLPISNLADDYIFFFKKDHRDTANLKYNIIKVYLLEVMTHFFDNNIILEKMNECIKDAWNTYNEFGNKMWATNTVFNGHITIAIIEYEMIKPIYNKTEITDGTPYMLNYNLYFKEELNKYFGKADFEIEGITVSIDLEYTKKPTEKKFVKDLLDKFCKTCNIELEEDTNESK